MGDATTSEVVFMADDNMSGMSRSELAELGGRNLVYVRTVVARDVMDDLVDDDGALMEDIPDDATLYSVHASDGERIALVGDRALAFAARAATRDEPGLRALDQSFTQSRGRNFSWRARSTQRRIFRCASRLHKSPLPTLRRAKWRNCFHPAKSATHAPAPLDAPL